MCQCAVSPVPGGRAAPTNYLQTVGRAQQQHYLRGWPVAAWAAWASLPCDTCSWLTPVWCLINTNILNTMSYHIITSSVFSLVTNGNKCIWVFKSTYWFCQYQWNLPSVHVAILEIEHCCAVYYKNRKKNRQNLFQWRKTERFSSLWFKNQYIKEKTKNGYYSINTLYSCKCT